MNMSQSELVILRISDGIVANDQVDPPKPLVFQLEEVDSFQYHFRAVQVQELPLLGYHLESEKLNLVSRPVIGSPRPLTGLSRLFFKDRVQIETSQGVTEEWYLYVDPSSTNQTFPEPVKSSNQNLLWILFLVIFVLLVLFGLILMWSSQSPS